MKSTKRRLFEIMARVDPSFKINENIYPTYDFTIETIDGNGVEFSVAGYVSSVDRSFAHGFGVENDVHDEISSYDLVKGSYDPKYETEIRTWMENNDSEIIERLSSQL